METQAKKIKRTLINEPTQSDTTLLLKVEDLIHMAMGPSDRNVVNFKLVQTVLYILARQLRVLDQKVEIRVAEIQRELEEEGEVVRDGKGRQGVSVDEGRRGLSADKGRHDDEDREGKGKRGTGVSLDKGRDGDKDDDERRKRGREVSTGKGRYGDKDEEGRGKRGHGVATDKGRHDDEDGEGREKRGRGESPDKGRRDDEDEQGRGKRGRGSSTNRGRRSDEDEDGRGKIGGVSFDKSKSKRDDAFDKDGGIDSEDEQGEGGAHQTGKGSKEAVGKGKRRGEGADAYGREGEVESEYKEERTDAEGKGGKKGTRRDEPGGSRTGRGKVADAYEEEEVSEDEEGGRADSQTRGEGKGAEGKGGEKVPVRGGKKDERGEEGTENAEERRAEDKGGKEKRRGSRTDADYEEEEDGEREVGAQTGGKMIEAGERAGRRSEEGVGKEEESRRSGDKGIGKAGKEGSGRITGSRNDEKEGKDEDEGRRAGKTGVKARGTEQGKGAAAGQPARVGSIEVVTLKQFAVLEEAVKELKQKAAVPPTPTLPGNKKLRDDLTKGSASLTDTMQALQLSARVQAAEKAIEMMADMLTQLATAGALPEDIADQAVEIETNLQAIKYELMGGGVGGGKPSGGKTGRALDIEGAGVGGVRSAVSDNAEVKDAGGRRKTVGGGAAPSAQSGVEIKSVAQTSGGALPPPLRTGCVTNTEMEEALEDLRNDLLRSLTGVAQKALSSADLANATIQRIADKMDTALKLDSRISFLSSLVNDYADQLQGFDTGLNTQMAGFQEQMNELRTDLRAGLVQLEQVNNNAETAALLELTERYEVLVAEQDNTLHAHQSLTTFQRQLAADLKNLLECIEIMKEEKADRDEVIDGLRDKADVNRLTGLVSEEQFSEARQELEMRMQMCYDKFRKQDTVWKGVVEDFSKLADTKAELIELVTHREDAEKKMRALHRKVQQLTHILGDPRAAIITRMLAKDGRCAACGEPALMNPEEPEQLPRLPAARPVPQGADSDHEGEPCQRSVMVRDTHYDGRTDDHPPHMCLRWAGGSHTLMAAGAGRGAVCKERAARVLHLPRPVNRYLGAGTDGKLYNLEVDILPCKECNPPESILPHQEASLGHSGLPVTKSLISNDNSNQF